MTTIGWSMVDVVSQLLERDEREAVCGDLAESGEGPGQALLDVFGLVVRRHMLPWKSWRPWLAAFGLALPGTLLLLGLSFSISQTYQRMLDPVIFEATGLKLAPGLSLLLCQVSLLIGWSWTCGFVMGSVSRRTVWVSVALSCIPCLFCLSRFHIESMSRFCVLLFLPPAVWGVSRGLQIAPIRRGSAIALAVGITVLTIPTWSSAGPWIPNWALSWPAWYMVATARRSSC
jgi:hypothetical protein